MRGKTNTDVFEGGVEFTYILAFSVYDTKTVNFLSLAAEKLVCNINEKEIYDKATKKKLSIQFYCTELQFFLTITRIQLMLPTIFGIHIILITGRETTSGVGSCSCGD